MTPRWLIISGDLVPTGGMDSALLGLANDLAERDPVEVVAHRIDAQLQMNHAIRFVQVPRPFGAHLLGSPFLAYRGWRESRRLQRQGTRTISNGGNSPGRDINWVHYVHAAYTPRSSVGGLRSIKQRLMHSVNLWAERSVLKQSKYIICNSHRTANDVVQLVGVHPNRVRVIYYGSDPLRLVAITSEEREQARAQLDSTVAERPWAVFVGAMGDHRKGFDTLYAAWHRLAKQTSWDAILWVVGRGAEQASWTQRSQADGLQNSIRFLGFREDVPRILAACDVLIHPARYEAYGLGVHEAICRGIPAIVSRSAGVAERYPPHWQSLLIDQPDDATELVTRLQDWRHHWTEWPSRVAPIADQWRRRTWADMAAEFVQVVQEKPG